MINRIKTALRSFGKNRIFSFVTIAGLSIAFVSFLVVLLVVRQELSYDRWHQRPEEVYRVVKDFVNADGGRIPDATTPPALATVLRKDLPEVAHVTRFTAGRGRTYLIQSREKGFYETSVLRVDSQFFKVLDFPFVAGDRNHPFKGIHSIVLTAGMASKYFGQENPIGKVLRLNVNNGIDYEVSAVIKKVPAASHFTFDFLIPFESARDVTGNWNFSIFYTYVRLKPGSDAAAFQTRLQSLFKKYQPKSLDEYYVQPLTSIHLQSNLKWELSANSDWNYIRILITIAVLILLIAAVNYINMVTAQAMRRAKEVGVRKVTGASRASLIGQFLTESLLIAVLAFGIALVVTSLLLPYTELITGYPLSLRMAGVAGLFIMIAAVLFLGLAAGIYPAFYLSSFQPVKVLKGIFLRGTGGLGMRQGLVVFQFLVSAILITGFLTINKQLDFIQEKKLGFEEENVLMLPNVRGNGRGTNNPESLVDILSRLPEISRIGRGDGSLAGEHSTNGISVGEGLNRTTLNFIRADDALLPTLGVTIKEGRNFSRQYGMDSSAVILNETAVRELGLQPPYVGQLVYWDRNAAPARPVQIVGVVADFHFTSLHEAIKPFGFVYEKDNGSTFYLRLNKEAALNDALARVEQTWKKYDPDKPFTYAFLDEQVSRLYAGDRQFRRIFFCLTLIAIGLACLGLFGLTTYIAESKTKEIGIRKVLGSTVGQILWLLSLRFVKLAIIALLIAMPVAWFLMHQWLQQFAYRTGMPWWIFAITGILLLTITFATVTLRSVKAAMTNPARSLRME